MPDYDRTAYLLRAVGNVLLVVAAVIFVVGGIAVVVVVNYYGGVDFSGGRGPGFRDYLQIGLGHTLYLLIAASIPAIGGAYFRFLSIQQEQRAVEMELLLDAIAPLEDENEDSDVEVTA